MAKHLLHYWLPATAAHNLEQHGDLTSIGSAQLSPRKIQPDDTIWIVTVEDGILLLLGRVIVGEVIEERDAAVERLGTDNLWEAPYTVVPQPGTTEPLRPINLSPVADLLTFQSRRAPRLTIVDGKVNPQQLQSTRLLTPDSADLLEACWNDPGDTGEDE